MQRPAEEDRVYFLKRASEHRKLALDSRDEALRALHQRFAGLYTNRAGGQMVDQD